jgi:hypothetical protein
MPEGHRRRRREACWTATSTAASSPQKDADYQDPAPFIRGSSPPLTTLEDFDNFWMTPRTTPGLNSIIAGMSSADGSVVRDEFTPLY